MVVEHIGETAIGVAGGGAHLQGPATEGHPIAMAQGEGNVLRADGGGQANGAAGGLGHQPASGHMVGMGVGVEGGHQGEAQLLHQGEVAGVLLKHRIDQHPLSAGPVREQIGEGAGIGIEELAQQEGGATRGGQKKGGRSGGEGHNRHRRSYMSIAA